MWTLSCWKVDSLRVFRFVQGRDSLWRKHDMETDNVDAQGRKMMALIDMSVVHALSPQTKGKAERPYRWLEDRIVRTCVYENLSTIEEVRSVLKAEVDRDNNHQVHSTTGEILNIHLRFGRTTSKVYPQSFPMINSEKTSLINALLSLFKPIERVLTFQYKNPLYMPHLIEKVVWKCC